MYPRTASFTESGSCETVPSPAPGPCPSAGGPPGRSSAECLRAGPFQICPRRCSPRRQAGKVEAVNGFHHLVELALIIGAIRRHRIGGLKHQIDSGVEFPTRGGKIFHLVKLFSRFEAAFGAVAMASPAVGRGRQFRSSEQENGEILQIDVRWPSSGARLYPLREGLIGFGAGGRSAIWNFDC